MVLNFNLCRELSLFVEDSFTQNEVILDIDILQAVENLKNWFVAISQEEGNVVL